MGNSSSSPEKNEAHRDQVVENSSGSHLVEIHGATAGMSTLFIILLGVGLFGVYSCLKSYRSGVKRKRTHNPDVESGAFFHPPLSVWQSPHGARPFFPPMNPYFRGFHDVEPFPFDWPTRFYPAREQLPFRDAGCRVIELPMEDRPPRLRTRPLPRRRPSCSRSTTRSCPPSDRGR